jgi:leucyl-tRNA synthetase
LEWSDSGVEGAHRFLKRVWHLVQQHVADGECPEVDPQEFNESQREMRRLLHDAIAKVDDDVDRRFTFNTAIAAVMELCNHLARFDDSSPGGRAVRQEAWLAVVRLIWPFTPHISEALWAALDQQGEVSAAGWPKADAAARVRERLTLVIQVNGKLRARLEAEPGLSRDDAVAHAMALENVQRHVEGKDIRKVIHVPDRLVNIVVG